MSGPGALTGKRVCFVIEKLADRSGGAERVMIDVANDMAARGHQVDIVSHEHRGKPPFYRLAPGVVHSNLRPRDRHRGTLRRALDIGRKGLHQAAIYTPPMDRVTWLSQHGGFWRRVEAHLDATRPDAAVAFLPPAITALAMTRPSFPLRRLGSIHNVPEQDYGSIKRWDPNPRDRLLRRSALNRLDGLTVLLPEFRAWFGDGQRGRIYVIPNAVPRVSTRRLTAARRRPVVLAVGRLAEVKRHDLLIRAWARLKPDFPDWSLKIFGQGPMEADLRRLADALGLSDSLQLGVHTSDMSREYLSASILAHPAEYEGFGLAVSEALSHGLPAIGFADCSGVNTLVRDGVNGVLVSPGKDRLAAYADALAALMRDDDRRAALSAEAPESVALYAPKAVYDLWEGAIFPA